MAIKPGAHEVVCLWSPSLVGVRKLGWGPSSDNGLSLGMSSLLRGPGSSMEFGFGRPFQVSLSRAMYACLCDVPHRSRDALSQERPSSMHETGHIIDVYHPSQGSAPLGCLLYV
jgi:hypothetical protein